MEMFRKLGRKSTEKGDAAGIRERKNIPSVSGFVLEKQREFMYNRCRYGGLPKRS